MKFYTYVYRRPNGEPIYVGKGCRKRAWDHLKRTDHHPLTQCLDKMKRANESPTIEILHQATERLAFLTEALLISDYGRKNLGKRIPNEKHVELLLSVQVTRVVGQ